MKDANTKQSQFLFFGKTFIKSQKEFDKDINVKIEKKPFSLL